MAIEKRVSKRTSKATYRVRLRLAGHGELSSTHPRLSDARDWERDALTALKAGTWGPAGEARRHTLAEAIDRYLAQLPHAKLRDERNRRRHLKWWRDELGDLPLCDCTPARVAAARDKLMSTPIRPSRTNARLRQPATVVRFLAALSHVFTVAIDDWA